MANKTFILHTVLPDSRNISGFIHEEITLLSMERILAYSSLKKKKTLKNKAVLQVIKYIYTCAILKIGMNILLSL